MQRLFLETRRLTKSLAEGKGGKEQVGNLAAGIVKETGDVVDGAGNTVGKLTEGEASDLGE